MSKKPSLYKIIKWFALLGLIAAIEVTKLFPHYIEKYYSTGIYVPISKFLRITTGWIPFSIGDVFYFLLILVCAFMKTHWYI